MRPRYRQFYLCVAFSLALFYLRILLHTPPRSDSKRAVFERSPREAPSVGQSPDPKSVNVLFMMSDDFRLEPDPDYIQNTDKDPTTYFPSHVHLPNLRALARKSVIFTHAFCQYPLCNPSRVSMLTSRRPDTTGVYDLQQKFRSTGGENLTTMTQFFKDQGYDVMGTGKIFHGHEAVDVDEPKSWSGPFSHPETWREWRRKARHMGATWVVVSDKMAKELPIPEEYMVQYAESALQNASRSSKPFFLGVGFHRPHEPVLAPSKFFSMYSSVDYPSNYFRPKHVTPFSFRFAQSVNSHVRKVRELNISSESHQRAYLLAFKRAYYSAITYVDDHIGDVLRTLKNQGLDKNTIIVFCSDHGRLLGEHMSYGKHSLYELATQVPLMIHIPGLTDRGMVRHQLVELVDLFPTLAEAAGLPSLTPCPRTSRAVSLCTEGESLMPLIRSSTTVGKSAVFSQILRDQFNPNVMGYSIRTHRFRYTEWLRHAKHVPYQDLPHWDKTLARELYDLKVDPDQNCNYGEKEEYSQHINHLHTMLKAGWRTSAVSPAKTPQN